MRIELRSTLRRSCFAGACLIVVGLYLWFVGRAYLAAHVAANPNLLNLQTAIRLEPSNAEYRELLGRNLALSGASLDDAISHYRTAVHLNPYESRYWLDLAGAYQVSGSVDEQEQAVEQAVNADPTTPHVAAEAANFFLLQGNLERALRHFRTVLANDPEAVNPTLQLCWRVTGDANQIFDQALPRRTDLYSSFLQLLVSKQEVVAAQNAWQQLAKIDEALQTYLPSRENLIVNGGFEENLLNGGFDWWYESNPHAALAIDTDQFYMGTRSLSVIFDGRSVSEARISQFIPVKPDTD